MEQFQQKFIEEAKELINKLEEVILDVELGAGQYERIDEIFRIMHTLKGASGMFGFNYIAEYTHHLEDIYDQIRAKKILNSQEIIDVTLKSVDHLRVLLSNKDELDDVDMEQHLKMIKDLEKINNSHNSDKEEIEQVPLETNNGQINTYYIFFKPYPDIFSNGTNPLFIVDELVTLGQSRVFIYSDEIPELNLLNTDKSYIYWEVLLATDVEIDEIKDVFLFVEDEAQIHIQKLADENMLINNSFDEFLNKTYRDKRSMNIEDLNTFVAELLYASKTKELHKKTGENKSRKKTEKESAISSIRVDTDKIDELMNLVSELVTTQASLNLYVEKYNMSGLTQIIEGLENLTRQLRDNAFSISLVPIEVMVIRFKRLVRDLASEFNKIIDFQTIGTDTEMDKSLIQELSDPLMHIVRNSIDHGIEFPEERIALGKPEHGTIILRSYYSGTNVIVSVKDDGRGINLSNVRNKAIQKEMITDTTVISDQELLQLIFEPGFSTATAITDVSGRGVGMDVVKRKIDEIHGQVEITTQAGVGTEIIIKLPLTLSIIDGMLLKVGNTTFVLPLSEVKQIYPIKHTVFEQSYNSWVVLDGQQVPYFYLRNEFNEISSPPKIERVITISHDGKTVGIVTDDVIGNHQSVLKPIGKFFKKQQVISAATILGDGTVALVLDPHKIVDEFSKKDKN